jgi:hypothetical protein
MLWNGFLSLKTLVSCSREWLMEIRSHGEMLLRPWEATAIEEKARL